MPTRLYKFMRNIYHAYPLELSLGVVRPGMLIETTWGWGFPIDSRPTFKRHEGFAWDVLDGVSEEDYESEFVKANIMVGTISDRIKVDLSASLPQFGLSVSAGFTKQMDAVLSVSTVQGRIFKKGFSGHDLRRRLRQLGGDDKPEWKWVDNDFLVTEAYHTGDLSFEFKNEGGLSAKAELERAGVKVGGEFKAEWQGEERLVLRGTADVPFAIRGFKV